MLKRLGVPVLYLSIVFLCGLAIGVSGYRLYELKAVSANDARGPRPLPPPEEWKRRHIKELQDRLHLTSAQSAQVSQIMDEAHGEIHDLMEKTRPEMDRIQNAQYAKVKAILTPPQIVEYEKFHDERERRRALDRRNF